MRFLLQFHNILSYILPGAGFVKLLVGLWLDAAVILGVVLINGLVSFVQEGRAERALDSIRTMLSAEARCLRDGEVRLTPAQDLVPGDVVLLESGDKIPADLRLVEVRNLRTEEAALTGESVPADKSTDPAGAGATGTGWAWPSRARWSRPDAGAGTWWRPAPRPSAVASTS